MSIKKVSDLDGYLDSDESLQLSTFKNSLFEVSKKRDVPAGSQTAGTEHLYTSRSITGNEMLSAVRDGLTGYFANTGELSNFTSNLDAIMNIFKFDRNNNLTAVYFGPPIESVTVGGTTVLNVTQPINGTAKHALWS